MNSNSFFLMVPAGSLIALLFATYLSAKILRQDEGSEKMKDISLAIREGAHAYLKRQYMGVSLFFGVMFIILFILSSLGYLTIFTPFAFLTGGFFSALAGFVGMLIATRANSRTTFAAKKSLNHGLRVAFSSGTVMGLIVVGLSLLDLSIWYFILDWYYRDLQLAVRLQNVTSAMLTSGMGASSMALFARVGGGIFTKAADVGADLVGKIEADIPEDDPRNPAVIADNVGDNVGDVAGMGADLYESCVGSIVATAALAISAGFDRSGVLVPMIMASIGIIASIIGTFFVSVKDKLSQAALLGALRRGNYISAIIISVASFFLIRALLGVEHMGIYKAIIIGLLAGLVIGYSTEYFTSASYPPTKGVSSTAPTGSATVIIRGLSVGMASTVVPVVTIGAAILLSYYLAGGATNVNAGLYGVGIAAVGMLSTLGITLATDAYGPVADNAGGIAEMSGQEKEVRERTDALDSLGNTTAATGKGFAIGSAALTALALIAAYKNQVQLIAAKDGLNFTFNLSILNPMVLVGIFIGGMLPFFFSSITMKAVGRAAQSIATEVRRQFKEIQGLMEGTARADYARCVDICTKAAQKEMIAPALVAIISPLLVGIFLGVNGVAGLLIGATVSGFAMAVMMANAGGSWDNAKKYIEEGRYGGKGSKAHKAAVVGDTVGDPFKDTSGPALNILIKLVSMVSIVFASFILHNSIL
jgi:K(+)-stimulated pyrophosphate-energized sodium pump